LQAASPCVWGDIRVSYSLEIRSLWHRCGLFRASNGIRKTAIPASLVPANAPGVMQLHERD
ncbi:MAG: hypothetical protein WCA38_14845, partial [Candidatus Acidiferrales bacterium]